MDVLDRMGHRSHPEEDHLERYVMKTCSEQELEAIEEHLMACEQCRARLYQAEEYVALWKIAVPLGPSRRRITRWRQTLASVPAAIMSQWIAQPMAVAASCAALAAVLLAAPLLFRQTAPGEEFLTLAATRGQHADAPVSSSAKLLRLRLDTTDLSGEPLEGQVVDVSGSSVWTELITQAHPELKLDRTLKPGVYWVRINSRQGDHANLREFRIEVR